MQELPMPKTNKELMQIILNRLDQLGKSRFWLSQQSQIGGPLYHYLTAKTGNGLKADRIICLLDLLNIQISTCVGEVSTVDCIRDHIRQKTHEAGTITEVAKKMGLGGSDLGTFIRYKKPITIHCKKLLKVLNGLNAKLLVNA